MTRREVKQELRKMIETESKILDAMISGEGTEKDYIYLCSKLFEVAEYIIALKDYLEKTRNNEN